MFASITTRRPGLLAAALLALLPLAVPAQHRPMDVPAPTQPPAGEPTRVHLILKDGSFQIVFSYRVVGNVVRYRSAERDGAEEDIPLALVDLPATQRWKQEHTPGAQPPAAVLSPELAREEAARAALTPQVAPDLHLPEEDSVLALDTFRATPELIPLPQNGSDLNKETAHALNRGVINPASAPHRILDIERERADVQLHVPDPVFFVRLSNPNDNQAVDTGNAYTVDTHGASGRSVPAGGSPGNAYFIERLDVRAGGRVLSSPRLALLGSGRAQPDIIETRAEPLPGGNWLKLTPLQPLEFGEYALVEVLAPNAVNLNIWDFGVHSDAPENVEALHPELRRSPSLERRRQP